MKTEIKLQIQAQPDDETCGPTCLHSLYRFYGDDGLSLKQVCDQIQRLVGGGTLIEILGCHALRRGFEATIYTFHIQMFDPTWFAADGGVHNPADVSARLASQLKYKKSWPRFGAATRAYREFLERGGQLRLEDLTVDLIQRHLTAGQPILAGLSSTYLYRQSRVVSIANADDDIRGEPQGHFVMIVGFDSRKREFLIADPLDPNPPFHTSHYRVSTDRLINAILLGILTHDANLMVITPPSQSTAPTRPARRSARRPTQRARPARPTRRRK
jgi:hypothetical protein